MEGERVSDSIQRSAYLLAIMLIVGNVMLFVGGYFEADEIPTVWRIINCTDLSNVNSDNKEEQEEFQESFLLRNQDCDLESPVGDSFAVTVLDFLEDLPLVGSLITLFRIIFELIYVMAFGSLIIMIQIGVPWQIYLPIGIAYFLIMVIAMYNILISFTLSRGGTK